MTDNREISPTNIGGSPTLLTSILVDTSGQPFQYKLCPHCGAKLVSTAVECTSCSKKFDASDEQPNNSSSAHLKIDLSSRPSGADTAEASEYKLCRFCGANLLRTAVWCPSCRRDLSKGGEARSTPIQPMKSGQFVGWVLGVSMVLAVGVLLVWLTQRFDLWLTYSISPKLSAKEIAAREVGLEKINAETMCIERFDREAAGLMPHKTYGTTVLGNHSFETDIHGWVGDAADRETQCQVRNGQIVHYSGSDAWYPQKN